MNLVEGLLEHPPERVALRAGGHATTYGDLTSRVEGWAGVLAGRFEAPARVALLSGTDECFIVGYLATLHAGLVCVPLNPGSPGPELIRELESIEPVAVIVGPTAGGALESIRTRLDERSIAVLGPDELDAASPAESPAPIDVDPDQPAVLLFTSGTAGLPKAAILTHANLDASLRSVLSLPLDLRAHDHRALALIPLFHVMGLNVIVNLGLTIGATLVLEDHVGPARTAELVAENDITILAGPPQLWQGLAELDRFAGADTLLIALSGAAPLAGRVGELMQTKHGVTVREGYGLTETCGTVASAVGEADAPIGSVGRIMPGVECRLVDPSGQDVYVGDVGEIWVRGPMLSPGYWRDEAATRACRTRDGWLRTGDLGIVDEDGYLAVVNRQKDLVIVSGFNVHPGEVEFALEGHPAVAAAAVSGERDPDTGERVIGYVTLKSGAEIDSASLRAHCAEQLARYKVPKRVEIVEELPTGLVGKLRRQDLAG